MDLINSTDFWYLLSFIAFCALAYYGGRKQIGGTLDAKIDAIRKEVEQAETMRVEAQELLAQYQRKNKEAEKEADEIIARAKESAKAYEKEAKAKIDEEIKRREAHLKERLQRMEERAIAELRNHAADLTLRATSEIVASSMSQKENTRLTDEVVKSLPDQRAA